jgi:hypothetical protein
MGNQTGFEIDGRFEGCKIWLGAGETRNQLLIKRLPLHGMLKRFRMEELTLATMISKWKKVNTN